MAAEWQHGARELHVARRPVSESHRVYQAEPRDPVRVANRQRLSDPATDVVPDDAGVVYSENIEQLDDAVSVGPNPNGSSGGPIAPTVPEKIDDDHSMSRRNERYHVTPQVTRCGEAMQEHD